MDDWEYLGPVRWLEFDWLRIADQFGLKREPIHRFRLVPQGVDRTFYAAYHHRACSCKDNRPPRNFPRPRQ